MRRYDLSPSLASEILAEAKSKGASAGDVLMVESRTVFASVRLGETDKVSQAEEKRLGLRLFCGKRSASASTSDVSAEAIDRLIADALAMARVTAADEFAGLPAAEALAGEILDLDLLDPRAGEVGMETAVRLARQAEASALEFDRRIVNSEGAEFSSQLQRVIYASTNGFSGEYRGSHFHLSVAPVAALNGAMQRDYWYSSQRKFDRLESPEAVGRRAAERALRRLGARKVRTRQVPVVFDPEVGASLLRHLSSALSGYALYKGASFLLGRLGERIAAEGVSVIDDGTIVGALGSKPFDGEGVATRRKLVVERGVLRSYLLDTYSGRKLGCSSTGNAARAVGEAPGVAPTNFFLAPGPYAPEEIIGSVDDGFYVTELIGFGVNLVTGDYSRGACGLWIEGGKLACPVEEVTIAGNLNEMLLGIEMVGSDLELRSRIASPTLKISRMTVAGE